MKPSGELFLERKQSRRLGVYIREATRKARGRGARPPPGRALHPRGQPGALLAQLFYSIAFFWSKNKFRQVSGQLDSVWFSFSAILKNKEKTETGTGL